MRLWSFAKGAGSSIFGGDGKVPNAADLEDLVSKLGLNQDGLVFKVSGDTVEMVGEAADQKTKEKIIMAVGNVEGIATVDDKAGGDDPALHTVEKGDTLCGYRIQNTWQRCTLRRNF